MDGLAILTVAVLMQLPVEHVATDDAYRLQQAEVRVKQATAELQELKRQVRDRHRLPVPIEREGKLFCGDWVFSEDYLVLGFLANSSTECFPKENAASATSVP